MSNAVQPTKEKKERTSSNSLTEEIPSVMRFSETIDLTSLHQQLEEVKRYVHNNTNETYQEFVQFKEEYFSLKRKIEVLCQDQQRQGNYLKEHITQEIIRSNNSLLIEFKNSIVGFNKHFTRAVTINVVIYAVVATLLSVMSSLIF